MFFSYLVFACFIGLCNSQACDSVLTGSGVIKSEGHPAEYPSNYDCKWIIEASNYDTVYIRFIDFHVEPGENCPYDYVEITAMGQTERLCGNNVRLIGNFGRFELNGTVLIHMVTDGSVNYRGIYLEYRVIPGEPPPVIIAPTTPAPISPSPITPSPATTCDDEPCQNGGTCVMDGNEFICFCPDGFEGILCEINIDDCTSNPCENGATCIDGVEAWSCECVPGYIGETCGIDYDECRSEPCQNGGTCVNLLNQFRCVCEKGWTGRDCSEDIDECDPNPCQNYGVCEDHLGYHTCICHPSYTGENCTIPIQTTNLFTTTTSTTTTSTTTTSTTTTSTTTTSTTTISTTTISATTTSATTTFATATSATTTSATTISTPTATTTTAASIFPITIDTTTTTIETTAFNNDRTITTTPSTKSPVVIFTTDSIYKEPGNQTLPTIGGLESFEKPLAGDANLQAQTAPTTPNGYANITSNIPTLQTIFSTNHTSTASTVLFERFTPSYMEEVGITDSISPSSSTPTIRSNNTDPTNNQSSQPKYFLPLFTTLAVLGGIFTICFFGALIYLLIHYSNQHCKITPKDRKQVERLENQTLSPTSTDSGISGDVESRSKNSESQSISYQFVQNKNNDYTPNDEINYSYMKPAAIDKLYPTSSISSENNDLMEINKQTEQKSNTANSNFTKRQNFVKLPNIFSPRPSPVTTPTCFPFLKEDQKIIEKKKIDANLNVFSPPEPQRFIPNTPVFKFSLPQDKKTDAKLERKRKIATRSRGPRPKTAALGVRTAPDEPKYQKSTENKETVVPEYEENVNRPHFLPQIHPSTRPIATDEKLRTILHSQKEIKSNKIKKNLDLNSDSAEDIWVPSSIPKFSTFRRNQVPHSAQDYFNETSFTSPTIEQASYLQPSMQHSSFPDPGSLRPWYERAPARGNSFFLTDESMFPAHSLEEVLESRVPQSFSMQRIRRLAPLQIRNEKIKGSLEENNPS